MSSTAAPTFRQWFSDLEDGLRKDLRFAREDLDRAERAIYEIQRELKQLPDVQEAEDMTDQELEDRLFDLGYELPGDLVYESGYEPG